MRRRCALKDVRSPERLLDECCLFLHRPMATLPEEKRQMIDKLHQAEAVLAGKKVLIVDDDIRNIFAMTSMLEPYQMQIALGRDRQGRDRDPAGRRRTSTSC